MKSILRFLICIALLLPSVGCDHRELCYDHSHMQTVKVEFDWSQAPDASPATMVVWFFPTDGSQGFRYELLPSDQDTRSTFDAEIRVPAGTYRVFCHNGSTDNNSERGTTFDDYSLITFDDELLKPLNRAENAPRPEGTENQPVRASSSEVWAHTLSDAVTITRDDRKTHTVRFAPQQMHENWHITITGVENLTADMDVSAIVTGVAEAYSPASENSLGSDVTIPFGMRHCGTDCLKGDVTVFGDNAPHDIHHYLRIYTSFNYYYDFDITEQVHKASTGHDIEISLAGLKLHNPSGGMMPGVSGWENAEDQDLKM